MRTRQLFISLALGLGLTLALLWLLGGATLPPAHAAASQCPDQRPLLQAGGVITVCLSGGCDYTSIQDAMDAAVLGEEILVAAGTYTDVNNYGGLAQVVYVSKTVTIRGGYNVDFSAWDPETYFTTLDARGRGRVLYITGDISPTIEGLRITGGDATGLGGGYLPWLDVGGGVYIISATTTFSSNLVYSTTAYDGGGLYLSYGTAALRGNTVTVNTANRYGGGLLLYYSDATLISNTITANTSSGLGSGLFIGWSGATLIDNVIAGNVSDGSGGGLWISGSDVTLTSNTITGNSAHGTGGGLAVEHANAQLSENIITDNFGRYSGGGINAWHSTITLSGNIIAANTTVATVTSPGDGGGLMLGAESDVTLINNLIVDNHAGGHGSGLYIEASLLKLLHNTIARNSGGDGSGVYIVGHPVHPWEIYYSTVALTNTILVSHTVGITVTGGNTATLEATLWGTGTWANGTDWGGTGTVITGARNYWGDPAFVDPDGGDYHIGATSAAIDKGMDAGVTMDIDGESRPSVGCDLGADEFPTALRVTKQADPDPVQAGAQLTYISRVTNTGNVTLTVTITDVLPDHVTPTGVLTWTTVITAPGGIWTEQFTVTVQMGYSGPLTNVVEVTTEESATGIYTRTSEAQVTPALTVTKEAEPDEVQAGAPLTHTIHVTNIGNVTLTATITDTLPNHVAPTGVLTWPALITAPGGVWTEQVVVTVEMDYTGPLTNVVEVTTDESATGIYTETVTSGYEIYLPLIMRQYL